MNALWGVLLGGMLAIAGGIATQLMQGGREHRRWIAENRRDEFRELLKFLMEATTRTAHTYGPVDPFRQVETLQGAADARSEFVRVTLSRIFIANEIENADVYGQWNSAMDELVQTNDLVAATKRIDRPRQQIVDLALRSDKRGGGQ